MSLCVCAPIMCIWCSEVYFLQIFANPVVVVYHAKTKIRKKGKYCENWSGQRVKLENVLKTKIQTSPDVSALQMSSASSCHMESIKGTNSRPQQC